VPVTKKKQSSGLKSGKKRGRVSNAQAGAAGESSERPPRAGLPADDSIVAEKTFKSPKGRIYRILITDELDAYDQMERTKTKRGGKK
jgi:hypothetical protein